MTVPARDLLSNPEKFDDRMGVTKMGAQKCILSMLQALRKTDLTGKTFWGIIVFSL